MSTDRRPFASADDSPIRDRRSERSALAVSAALRLAVVGGLTLLLWSGVWWAVAS